MHNFKLEDVFDTKAPYLLDRDAKRNIFLDHMNRLSHHHKLHCSEYKSIVSGLGFNKDAVNLNDVPYIPVRLFKLLNLMSVSRNDIFKQMTSSGTSGQAVSKIYLDIPVLETSHIWFVCFLQRREPCWVAVPVCPCPQ